MVVVRIYWMSNVAIVVTSTVVVLFLVSMQELFTLKLDQELELMQLNYCAKF